MASEEQINNQSRFNDLQRNSNELLTDYQAGVRESSEFVSILTTRTSQLVDIIKDTVSEKKKSTQADKDLINSITKINNLTKDFATPYSDAGRAIRDTNKATELHERLVKDIGVISNKLGKDRLNQAQEYLKAEEELGSLERTLAAERKTMTTQDQKSADKIVEAQRNKIEAERQYNKFIETSGINTQSLYAKIGAIKKLEEKQEVKRRAYQAAIKSGNQDAIDSAQKEYKQSQAAVTLYEDGLSTVEKTALARQRAKKEAQEQYSDEFKAGSEAAKKYSLNQKDADTQRDVVEEKQKQLDTDQKLYVEGEKAIKQSETGVKYLEEENKRVRQIIGAQTLWNLSLGAAEGILKKIGLDNQVIVLGLDEGTKAAKEYAAELIAGRQKARGEATLAQQASEDASQALINAEYQLMEAKLNGNAAQIQAAQKEYAERKKLSEQAKIDAADAEAASKKANSLVTKIGDSFRVLGKGVSATFKGMASELKALGALGIALALTKKLAKAIFSAFGGKIVTKFISDLVSKFTEGISYLKEQFFSLNSYIEDAKAGESFLQFMSQQTAEIATNLGIGTAESAKLITQAKGLSRELGMLPEELAKTTAELNIAFGTTQKFSDDTVKTMGQLTHQFGLTNNEASEFVKLSKLSGKETSDFTLETKTRIQSLKEASNIAISEKAVMQEIAKSSAAIQLSSKGQGKNLADAAFHAKKLGLSLAQTEAIGGSLLDFESSIANEMEAELLIGRDLNLDKARQFALNNDIAGVAKEIAGQIGSAAEFGKMNVLQQEALAKSVGVSRDELANMLKTQELLAGTGFNEMSEAQDQFKKLLKETGSEEAALAKMREGGASEALAEQIRVVSLQEKRAQQERDIVEAQALLAKNVNAMFTAFNKVTKIVKELKATIVDQMKPFFDQFASLIGKGGSVFKNEVNPYAKQLGKFMNDIGLRLIDIVKNQGPTLKSIFSGVLDLFGSIYNVVGGVVKQLLGINDASSTSSGFLSSMEGAIQSMVEKLKNVDISVLTEKIRGFIQGVKDTFAAIKEGIMKAVDLVQNSALGKFLSGDVGATSIAIAPLAFKGFKASGIFDRGSQARPMYVQDVNGSSMMDMASKMGGRQAGIGGGFKKGWKGLFDYAKMSLKGGRAGKVGRARIARAAKGLVTGQGASFVGGTGKGAAQAAGRLGGIVGKLGTVGKSLGRLAAGGGVGAIVGLAAEATLGHFAKKAKAAASALDEQIAMTTDMGEAAELEQKRSAKLETARNLGIAAETAKFAGYGAAIGTMIGGPFGAAIGGGVGALVGFTKGVIDAEKARKREESAAGKFARQIELAAIKHQKSLAQIEVQSATMRAKAAKQAAETEKSARENFAKQLAGANATFKDLQSMDLKHTDEAFKKLAVDALNAGQITDKEFSEALKGNIKPLDLLEKAAKRSGEKITGLTNAAISAADAVGNTLKNQMLAAAGVNEDVVNAQLQAIQAISGSAEIGAADLFSKFKGDLTGGLFKADSKAVTSLRGGDSDASGLIAEITKQFTDSGIGEEKVALAMEMYANRLEAAGEDFDLDEVGDITKLQQGIGDTLQTVLKSDSLKADAAVASAKSQVLTQIDDSGIIEQLASLSKEQIYGDEALQGLLSTIGVDMATVAEDGITGEEQKAIQEKLVTAVTEGLAGVDGGNANLLKDLQTTLSGDEAARTELIKAIESGTYLQPANESATVQTEVEISPKSKKGFSEVIATTLIDPLKEDFSVIGTFAKESFISPLKAIKNLFTGNFSEAFEDLKTAYFALPKLLGTAMKNIGKRIANNMWKAFLGFIKLAVTIGPKIFNAIKKATKKIISTFKIVTEKVKEFFQDPIGSMKSGFEVAIEFIKEKFLDLKDVAFEKLGSIGEYLKEKLSSALADVGEALGIDNLEEKLKVGFSSMVELAQEKFNLLKESLFSIFTGLGESIMGVIKGPLNTMIGLINEVINSINSSLSFEIPGVSAFGKELMAPITIETAIPTIPMLAEGGIVEQATLAVIGEAGPEAVIPLDQISKFAENDFTANLPSNPGKNLADQTFKLKIEAESTNLNEYLILPNIVDLNSYIVPPSALDLNDLILPPNVMDLNNFIIPPNVIDFNTYIIYPEPIDLGNYLIPPLPIIMDNYVFPPTPIELNNFILRPDIIDINSYIQILDILLNSYIKIAEIDITPYITIDDINLNQYIDKLINLNDYIGEDIDLLDKLLPIDLTQIMKMNAEETAALQSQLSEANAQLENQSLLEKGASFISSRFRSFTGAEEVDDFILRPGEPALKFNKDDLIIGGTNLEGGENNSSEGVGELKQELQDLKQIMSGFVEQMGQVVNRPINVELNGNKVGQALGQNSYKIQ